MSKPSVIEKPAQLPAQPLSELVYQALKRSINDGESCAEFRERLQRELAATQQ